MIERDYIYCSTVEKLPVGRDFIVYATDLEREMRRAFATQKAQARNREIVFTLPFEQWANVWLEGGKWYERGRQSDQYVMGRFGDTGAYEVGNVNLITVAQNVSDAQSGREQSDRERANRGAALKGRTFTDEHRANLSAANSGKKPWRGQPASDETRSKMSANAKASWAARKAANITS
jgi:hypothetical protein